MRGFEKLLKTTIDTLEHLSVAAHNQAPQPDYNYNYNYQQPPSLSQNTSVYEGAAYSRIVYPNPTDGRLVYPPYNEFGDHLFDFSAAGYNEGWTPLPAVGPVTTSLNPVPGSQDDSGRIQQAINELAATPSQGFKTLQLNKGNFVLARPVEIRSSGIIVQGDPAGGTVITVTTDPLDTPYVFKISGEPNVMSKKRVPIVDEYIPVGDNQVTVRDKNRFKVGDTVMVGVAFNEAWIKAVGMDVIIPKGDTSKNNGWKPGRFEHYRRIVKIDESGTRLTLNEPITSALAKKYGGGFVENYENKRVQNVGLQFLECVFPANKDRGPDEMMKSQKSKVKDYRFADEMFNHLLILMDHAENCWVRNVRSVWFRNFVRVGTNALAITFQHCYHTFPMPPFPDPKKPLLAGQFAFEISGQMILIEHCHAEYSFHAYSYKGRVPGPNVVYSSSCVAKNGDVGPHMKWSTGQLYDNCNVDGQIIIQDRYDAGSGHGWSGANSVIWNSVAHSGMIVQKPPLAQNFLIGSSSKRGKARVQGHEWAWEESPDRKVNPPSLYLAQLAERRQRLSPCKKEAR